MLNYSIIHTSWRPLTNEAMKQVDLAYLEQLQQNADWLPGSEQIFAAFSLALPKTNYILFGESPYPRAQSANGYAFWDSAVHELWSPNGLSKEVNRATSLRNFIKMLLLAEGLLSDTDTSQSAIAALDKENLVSTVDELFENFQRQGILLLNASLVLSKKPVVQDAKCWRPFLNTLLNSLAKKYANLELILLGNIAKVIAQLPSANQFKQFHAEHPYNISFIYNKEVQAFFKPMRLLRKKNQSVT